MLGRVHLITDSRPGADPVAQVRTLLAVATPDLVIQFRPAGEWTDRQVYQQGLEIAGLCADARITFLVNDRVDIALAVVADGVHVGAADLPVRVVRDLLGPGRIVGATARDAGSAWQAITDGADYVGVGPCYRTSTKDGLPPPLGPAGIAAVAPFAPVIAIGGVGVEHVPELLAAGAHGIAVIAAVADASSPCDALRALLHTLKETRASWPEPATHLANPPPMVMRQPESPPGSGGLVGRLPGADVGQIAGITGKLAGGVAGR